LKKSDLVKAAKELNKVLGCDPQIDIKADVESIKSDLLKAAALIEPADKITKETLDVVAKLKGTPEGKEEGTPSPDENSKPEAAGEKAENNDSAAAAAGETGEDSGKGKGKGKGKDATPATLSTPPAADPAGDKVTKKSVILECLKSKKGATIEQMAQKIVDLGIDADYDKNCRVVKAHLQKMGYDTKKASLEKNPTFKEA
jgi:hypothetical protein